MEKAHDYKLIEGIFKPVEAEKVLLSVLNSKISYHTLETFSNEIRNNGNIEHSQKRKLELTESVTAVKELVKYANEKGLQLKIHSDIVVELI